MYCFLQENSQKHGGTTDLGMSGGGGGSEHGRRGRIFLSTQPSGRVAKGKCKIAFNTDRSIDFCGRIDLLPPDF